MLCDVAPAAFIKMLILCLYFGSISGDHLLFQAEHSQELLQHINNQDPHIQFTVEPVQQDSLPFLDTLITIQPDNTLSTTVYRKPTHTDQYLHWDSNHLITAKQSVFNTLAHRAKTVSSTQDSMDKQLNHIKTALPTLPIPLLGPQPMASQVHSVTTTAQQPPQTSTTTIQLTKPKPRPP